MRWPAAVVIVDVKPGLAADRAGLVDRIEWFRAPAMIGGDGLGAVLPFGVQRIADMKRFAPVETRALGNDTLSVYERG